MTEATGGGGPDSGSPESGPPLGDATLDDATRQGALDRLRRGYDDGWLTADEHELRATLVRRARTRVELDRALHPGPVGDSAVAPPPGSPVSPVPPLQGTPSPAPGRDAAPPGRDVAPVPPGAPAPVPAEAGGANRGRGLVPLPAHVAGGLQGLLVFGVLALIFTGHTWLWFLVIPVAGIVFGSGLPEEDWAERRRQRRARKDARRIRRGSPPIPGEVIRRDDRRDRT